MFDINEVFWPTNSAVVAFIRKIRYTAQPVEELCVTFSILLCQMEQKSGVEHIHTSDDEKAKLIYLAAVVATTMTVFLRLQKGK